MRYTKFLIVGLPRSGTTLLSNIIYSHPEGFCFVEPHFHYARHQKNDFFKDEKLKKLYFLKYKRNAELPLDDALTRIQKLFPFSGFKETFRSVSHKRYSEVLPNEKLLCRYVDKGYMMLPIVRNPLDVWNSFKSFVPGPDNWAADIDLFLDNYHSFLQFVGDMPILVYEHLIENPQNVLKKHLPIAFGQNITLAKRNLAIGDQLANASGKVGIIKKKNFLEPNEKEQIENSHIMEQYQDICRGQSY